VFSHDREQAFAKSAMTLMGEANVPATPDNFELFYAYASGENPGLMQVMRGLIETKKPFTPDQLSDLRMRCLSGARAAAAMDTLGGDMGSLINDVMDRLESASRDTANYKAALTAATGQLGGERSPADVRKLVEGLVAATRAMEQRAKALEGELQASSEQVAELRDKLDDVRKESMTDPLTQIANRKAFDEAVKSALTGVAEGEEVSLLMCDIDHFKKFNDSWGHQTGDQVLRLVAACLSENTKGRDTAARYGGEEFSVLLRGTSLAAATKVADQIRATVETKKLVKKSTGDILGTITISIGVAQFGRGEGVESVVRRADACLYGAKHHGRNMVINQTDSRMAALEPSAA
jgi:diguanylate cyclase